MDNYQIIASLQRLEKHFEQLCNDAEVILNAPQSRRNRSDWEKGRLEGRYEAYQQTHRILKKHIDGLIKSQQGKDAGT